MRRTVSAIVTLGFALFAGGSAAVETTAAGGGAAGAVMRSGRGPFGHIESKDGPFGRSGDKRSEGARSDARETAQSDQAAAWFGWASFR